MHTIGVLALQGDWAAHSRALRELGKQPQPVRTAADLADVQSLIIPGGESTAMIRLMEPENLAPRIVDRIRRGMAVLATCAGVILLARSVVPSQPCLDVLAADVERNAYGRQLHSTVAEIELTAPMPPPRRMEGVFIRAPRIARVDRGVEVLGVWRGDPVLVRQDRIVAATFHPELTEDRRIHELFVNIGEDSNA